MKRLALLALLLASCEPDVRKPSGLLPKIDSFTASPMIAEPNQDVVLSWRTTNVIAVDVGPNVATNADPNGSVTVRPEWGMMYTLVAKGDGALTMSALFIEVRPATMPMIYFFGADPPRVTRGSTTTLAWTIGDATSLFIMDRRGSQIYFGSELEGRIPVLPMVGPEETIATFDLFAMDDFGQVAQQLLEVPVD